MTFASWILTFVLLTVGFGVAAAQGAEKPATLSREMVVHTIAEARRIVSPRGIDDAQAIEVNGTRQWISVRGKDRRNPILLLVHGGPGSPEMPDDWTFQTPWEDFFTVVEWDQRGAGKTFALNDPKSIEPTLTVTQMVNDTEVVIRYLLRTYGKQKIVLVGHSWGSVLGLEVAQRHPEWLYAYVGVGQVTDMRRSEEEGYAFALSEAKAHSNTEAIKELEAIVPYPGDGAALSFQKIGVQRKWLMYYGGLAWGRKDFNWDADAWELSPDYTQNQLDAVNAGSLSSITHLLGLLLDVSFHTTTLRCPLFLFVGRHDYATSHTLAESWFRTVVAPEKELVWFEDSSHMLMQEQQGRFLLHLVQDIRPLAMRTGDAAPDEAVER